MKYEKTVEAEFLRRLNRFTAEVRLGHEILTVHVKNTGRLGELLLPGARVVLAESDNPERKTKYDLVSVYREGLGWVNVDSQGSNSLMKEWLESKPEPFRDVTLIRPESVYGDSRMDFYLEATDRRIFIEVKGCTLEEGGVGLFPDAPTLRGLKHLKELQRAVSEGYEAYLAFVIAMPGVTRVLPNDRTQPEFGRALAEAKRAGVRVLFLSCEVEPASVRIISMTKE